MYFLGCDRAGVSHDGAPAVVVVVVLASPRWRADTNRSREERERGGGVVQSSKLVGGFLLAGVGCEREAVLRPPRVCPMSCRPRRRPVDGDGDGDGVGCVGFARLLCSCKGLSLRFCVLRM